MPDQEQLNAWIIEIQELAGLIASETTPATAVKALRQLADSLDADIVEREK